MKQKPVSYEVAKALKEAGYPQKNNDLYYNENGTVRCCSPHTFTVTYACPTYIDTMLWLWREKDIQIDIVSTFEQTCFVAVWKSGNRIFSQCKNIAPEEAIAKAIDYLVENNLIK